MKGHFEEGRMRRIITREAVFRWRSSRRNLANQLLLMKRSDETNGFISMTRVSASADGPISFSALH